MALLPQATVTGLDSAVDTMVPPQVLLRDHALAAWLPGVSAADTLSRIPPGIVLPSRELPHPRSRPQVRAAPADD